MKYLHFPALTSLSTHLSYSSGPQLTVKARIEAYSCKDVKKERKMRRKKEEEWMSELEEIEELSISPELKDPLLLTPFGPLSSRSTRSLHFLLTSTLNVAYPDYDFSSVRPEEFRREIGGVGGVLGGLSGVLNGDVGGLGGMGLGLGPGTSYGSMSGEGYLGTSMPNPTIGTNTSNTISSSSHSGSNNLLSPTTASTPLSHLPLTHPTLHKILSEVIDLNECIVFSYIPGAEADPHADEDGESEDGDEVGQGGEDDDEMEMDRGRGRQMEEDDDGDDEMMMMRMDDIGEDEGFSSNQQHTRLSFGQAQSNFGNTYNPNRNANDQQPPSSSWTASSNSHSYDHVQGHRYPASLTKESGYGSSSMGEEPMTPMDEGESMEEGRGRPGGRKAGGLLWSANYFLYCRRQRRILFITVWARKKEYGLSPQMHAVDALPIARSPHPSNSSLPGGRSVSFGQYQHDVPHLAMSSLDGRATEFISSGVETGGGGGGGLPGSSKTNPISIGGSPASITIGTSSGNVPGPNGPPAHHPKLRRERSESTASTLSAVTVNDRLKDLVGMNSTRASKRVKV